MTGDEPARGRRLYLQHVAATLLAVGVSGCSGIDRPPSRAAATSPASRAADETIHAGYETTEVAVSAADRPVRGSVTAAIANTPALRYRGLSETESLPDDRGMLFVFDRVADRTFVMRGMDFGIDIAFADADGTITGIHHAPAPEPDEDGENQHYDGRGQYVLEVSLDWTTDRDVEPGDRLRWGR